VYRLEREVLEKVALHVTCIVEEDGEVEVLHLIVNSFFEIFDRVSLFKVVWGQDEDLGFGMVGLDDLLGFDQLLLGI